MHRARVDTFSNRGQETMEKQKKRERDLILIGSAELRLDHED
ncbi:uncharacterized protein J3R85_001910 [Psidium guajava]|nr:uncharacterized protein J3R85_001910 [Psidium guajava]